MQINLLTYLLTYLLSDWTAW